MAIFGLTTQKGAQKRMDESIKSYRSNVEKALREFGITDDEAIRSFLSRVDESAGMDKGAGEAGSPADPKPDENAGKGSGAPGNGDPANLPDGAKTGTGEQKEAGLDGKAGGTESPEGQKSQPQGGQQPAPQGKPGQDGQQQQGTAPSGAPNPASEAGEDTQRTIAALTGRLEADEKTIAQIMPILQKMGIKVDQGGPQFGAAPENGGEERNTAQPGSDESKLDAVRGILGHQQTKGK